MIILANYGFSYPETREALCGEAMPTTSGNMLIIPFAGTMRDAETEKQGAVVSGFSEDNIYCLSCSISIQSLLFDCLLPSLFLLTVDYFCGKTLPGVCFYTQ